MLGFRSEEIIQEKCTKKFVFDTKNRKYVFSNMVLGFQSLSKNA
jgi:hypothetical protein